MASPMATYTALLLGAQARYTPTVAVPHARWRVRSALRRAAGGARRSADRTRHRACGTATVGVYLACAPKSNAVYVAMGEAMADVSEFGTLEVPLRLRNAPTRLMKNLGYGRDYRYAHDEPEAFAAGERYLPDEMPDRRYYRPVPRGLEVKISEALARLRARPASKG